MAAGCCVRVAGWVRANTVFALLDLVTRRTHTHARFQPVVIKDDNYQRLGSLILLAFGACFA